MDSFDIPHQCSYVKADFVVSQSNIEAYEAVLDDSSWPEGRLLILGPRYSGKTHLTRIWSDKVGATVIEASGLDGNTDDEGIHPQFVALKHAQMVAGNMQYELALFHLCNHLTTTGGRLLMTAIRPPVNWGVELPDLLSRLDGTRPVRIGEPDDDLLAKLYVKLFADRQISVSYDTIKYIMTRGERSYLAAQQTVDALDRKSLAAGRRISRNMIRELFSTLE